MLGAPFRAVALLPRRARPDPRLHVARVDLLAAVRAGRDHVEGVAAFRVDCLERRAGPAGGVAIAPAQKGKQDRDQVAPLLGEAVLEALGALAVTALLEDSLVDQRAQPRAEDVGGDPQLLL